MFNRPKNLTESLIPLMSMYALIGHGIFRFPAQQQHPVFSVIYAVLITALYLVALGFTLNFIFNEPWYGDDERIIFLVIYVNVGIELFGIILSWCNSKRFARIVRDLTKVDETLQQLGATFDYTRARNQGYGSILTAIVTIVIFNSIDCLWFYGTVPISQIYLIVSVLHHPVHINSIIVFNFCVSVRHVHLELGKIGKGLNEAYGVQMALEVAALFVLFTGLLYEFYILAFNASAFGRFRRMITIGVWTVVYSLKLISLNETCERVCTEAQRTGEIIHCLDENVGDSELANEINQFSLQLLHDPVAFSPAGLITLGHRFIRGFMATVSTYLVILIQMTPSQI